MHGAVPITSANGFRLNCYGTLFFRSRFMKTSGDEVVASIHFHLIDETNFLTSYRDNEGISGTFLCHGKIYISRVLKKILHFGVGGFINNFPIISIASFNMSRIAILMDVIHAYTSILITSATAYKLLTRLYGNSHYVYFSKSLLHLQFSPDMDFCAVYYGSGYFFQHTCQD